LRRLGLKVAKVGYLEVKATMEQTLSDLIKVTKRDLNRAPEGKVLASRVQEATVAALTLELDPAAVTRT
jgi:hypothetical protein